jgi:hypothetical protein
MSLFAWRWNLPPQAPIILPMTTPFLAVNFTADIARIGWKTDGEVGGIEFVFAQQRLWG